MRARLTENGVLTLYSSTSQLQVKVQVLYLSHWNTMSFLRVTDSKHLSPVMAIMKMNEKFVVGDIILIKKIQLQPSTYFRDDEIQPLIDTDLNHIIIIEYQVVEKRDKVCLLFNLPSDNPGDNSYWHSLYLIKNCLVKGDVGDLFFKEGEKRIQLLRPDCNMLRERGNELFKQRNYNKAILHYDMAKQKDNYDARVWNNSSQAFFSNEEFSKAKRDALVALKLDPFSKKAYYRASKAMVKAGDINGALEITEAGLYICGQCEELESQLNTIKGNGVSYAAGKLEELQNSTINNSKKKLSNGEVDSVTESPPPLSTNSNTKKQQQLNNKSKDSPKRNKNGGDSNNNLSDTSEDSNKQKEIGIASLLESAKMLFETGTYKNALGLYEVASATWGKVDSCEAYVVRYMIEVCKIKLNTASLKDVKNNLLKIANREDFPYIPAVHFWLSKTFELLEDQTNVIHHATLCSQLMENNTKTYSLFWPGTTEPIEETSPKALKKWYNEGAWRPTPLTRCRHLNCINVQNSNLAKVDIYPSDPDFRGYVEVECEELCSICYHPCCWKSLKEEQADDNAQPGKKTDKDFLGVQCFTPDCSGKILSIFIYDETSQLKNEICKDKKEKKAALPKLKKKKDKKKTTPNTKPEEKKRSKPCECEDLKTENDIEIVKEETAIFKSTPDDKKKCYPSSSSQGVKNEDRKRTKSNEITENKTEIDQDLAKKNNDIKSNPVNFEGEIYKVLKPNYEEEESASLPMVKKSKNKKKKKSKQVSQIPLGEGDEERFAHNEYLTRLKALKSQRDAFESDQVMSVNGVGSKYLPECVLDPERPFYLPQHLQENPAQLESILRSKMVTSTSSDIDKEGIATLLEFMYDWLKAQKAPMLISDPRIKEYITENFPPNALAYVNKCGGIRNFLLQSFRFALIDDVLCVSGQVVSAQQAAVHMVLEKFKSNKYLISDGHKAVKLSHLIDDTKSTCSSNSSLSLSKTTAAESSSSSVLTTSVAPPPKLGYSYKTAALSKVPLKEPEPRKLESDIITSVPDLISRPLEPPSSPNPNKFIPVGQQKCNKKKGGSAARKSKLKTMDIDDFDDDIDMEHLFNTDKTTKLNSSPAPAPPPPPPSVAPLTTAPPPPPPSVAPLTTGPSKAENLFQSDEELDNDLSPLQTSNNSKAKQRPAPVLNSGLEIELRERISQLESKLNAKCEQLNVSLREKDALKAQNQDLNDKFSQIKVKSNVEITTLKKSAEDAQEQTKMVEKNLECYRNQKEGEFRKVILEKARLQEEVKAHSLRAESLQITLDQLTTTKNQLEEDLKQKNLQLTEVQMKYKNLRMQDNALEDRAREAETKYLTAKRDLIKMHLEKTKKRLTAEVNKMRELLLEATDSTQPNKTVLMHSIKDWEEAVLKLNNLLLSVNEDGQKLLDYISLGRSLSHLPPGDLQVPSVPDLTVAHLLFVGKGKETEKVTPSSSTMGLMGLNPFSGINPSSSLSSQFGGFTGGGTLSLGQLGVPPSSSGSSLHSDMQSGDIPRSVIGSVLSGACRLHGSRIAENNLGFGSIANHSSARRHDSGLSSGSSGFSMNGVSPSLSSLLSEDVVKGRSSESSPVSVISSLSGNASEFTPSYSVGGKVHASNPSPSPSLFGGQVPWSITEDDLKSISYGKQQTALNLQAKEIKRPTKTIPSFLPSVLGGSVADLPLIAPQSSLSMNHVSSSASVMKPVGGGIASSSSSSSSSSSLSTSSSAFGLHTLLEASSHTEPRTVATPTTPTATKPKFQNLRSTNSIGAIGTLPPKVVRPIPRPGATTTNIGAMAGLQSIAKEDAMTTSAAYKRLMEGCKQKFGNEYPVSFIQKAIREVREQNKNSLSGLALETILEQIEAQLRLHKRMPTKPSIAPWAQLTQQQQEGLETHWQGPVRGGLDSISEDHCSICLETLATSPTHSLPCLHEFHIKCIKNWLERKSDCPICRKFALNNDEYPSLSSHGQ